MHLAFALVTGFLFAAGFFLILRRSIVRIVLGVALLSHAANLGIFTAAGLGNRSAPIIPPDATLLPAGSADPLPQALILTAIVIGFALQVFLLALVVRAAEAAETDDLDRYLTVDTADPAPEGGG
jgi:multicomponent Na+:H+ antiporter subunit C